MSPWWQGLSRSAVIATMLLLASGVFHLGMLWITGDRWDGPVSWRKPALFGLSSGVTLWSLDWIWGRLPRWRSDVWQRPACAWLLVTEVALITGQRWRGVPSHFNISTPFDRGIELAMLALIIVVTIFVVEVAVRATWLSLSDAATVLAWQIGLWFLVVSCGLGFAITALGHLNLGRGLTPEIWGPAGVLKYPHGAALHALQWLPVLAFCWPRETAPRRQQAIVLAGVAQGLLLAQALWQTAQGRARFETDFVGGLLLTLVVATTLLLAMRFWMAWRARSR